MAKKLWLKCPYNLLDIKLIQDWLQNMGKQGFRLVRKFGKLTCFEECSKSVYCFIYPRDDKFTAELERDYAYSAALSKNYNVYYTHSDNVHEPLLSHEVFNAALIKERVYHLKWGRICFILAAACLIQLISNLEYHAGIMEVLILFGPCYLVSTFAGFISGIILGILKFCECEKYKERIDSGGSNSHPAVKFHSALNGCLFLVLVVSILFVSYRLYLDQVNDKSIPYEQYSKELKFPAIEDIWPEKQPKEFDRNSITEFESYVAPTVIYLRQDSSQANYYGYSVDYFDMRSVSLAMHLEEELLIFVPVHEATKIPISGYDTSLYYSNGYYEQLFLRSGKTVLKVLYHGDDTLYDYLSAFSR